MWLLIVMESYYPSIYHFKTKKEAREALGILQNRKYSQFPLMYIAKLEDVIVHDELNPNFTMDNLYDIDWVVEEYD